MGSSRVTATQADASQLKVDASSVAIPVTDNAGSLTVDGSVTVTQATATNLKVDASGVAVPVTDNGGSLTVDGTVAVSGTATIAGTVTANAGTNLNTSALALDATVGTTNTEVGGLTETAPATDTASSGLNGRLQRIAQRLTSLIAVFNVGAGTEAAAVRVTLPTDGTGKVNAAQSGTWTVQPGNTANTTAWKVDGSAVTQPVSLAANQSVNVAQINGVTATMGNGASGTGVQRVTLANDSTGVIATVAAVTAITNALPAGANAIGKLAANSGVDIGDVDVTTVGTITPGTAATSLGKGEDLGHTTGDVGVMALAVRNDGGAALAGTDLDYIPLTTDSSGALRTVGGTGGTQYTEDVASAGAEALTLAGTIRQDTPAGSTTTDGDYANLKTDSVGRLWVNASGAAVPVTESGTWTVQPGNTANTTPWMVGGKMVTIAATLTRPADTTAYAAGDSVSSSTSAPTILTFTSCARATGGSGTIVRALMTDSAYSATPGVFELWLLDTTTTPTNDNAAFAPSDGDANTLVAIIPFGLVYAGTATAGSGGNMVYQSVGPWPFVTASTANLFGIIVVRSAYTPISAEAFQIRLIVAQD